MMLTGRRRGAAATVALGLLGLVGCSHLPHVSWPWSHRAPPSPVPVSEVVLTSPSGPLPPIVQYWKSNTLVLDLQQVSGSGSVLVQRRPATTWPVRLAVRVMPGSVGQVEVRAAQRQVLPIVPQGTKPVDLELPPGLYTQKTPEITIAWGPVAPLT